MQNATTTLTSLERNGFAVLKRAVPAEQIQMLVSAVEAVRKEQAQAGLRNLLSQSKTINEFATLGLAAEIAAQLLNGKPTVVRGILFDKTPQSNWYVTWHQDLSIPVRKKVKTEGYGPWSVKEGVIHVQPLQKFLSGWFRCAFIWTHVPSRMVPLNSYPVPIPSES